MRTLVIGDIHGGLKALKQVLERAKIQKEDTLIFLGDYVDGWSESAQVIAFLIDLEKEFNCIFIKGNHDIWAEDWVKAKVINAIWYENGGKETIESYQNKNLKIYDHIKFYNNMKSYYLDAKNRLFLHAGFVNGAGKDKDLIYCKDRTLIFDAVEMHPTKNLPERFNQYKEIYIGHTPVQRFGFDEPMNKLNVWNIDTGAAFKGSISILNIESKEFWQSNPVYQLYPNEKGRN